jgi:hypothetical protein
MTIHRCPGFDGGPNWKERDVVDVPCPNCGQTIEFWKDDAAHTCPACGVTINHPQHLATSLDEDLPRRDAVDV